jgi:hypothetical protein
VIGLSRQAIFVSSVHDPTRSTSSTDVMTRNLLKGLADSGCRVTFVAITEDSSAIPGIRALYSDIVEQVVFVPSRLHLTSPMHPLKRLFRLLASSLLGNLIRYELPEVLVEADAVIMSHSPSIESIPVAEQLQHRFRGRCPIQYWSDPIALSGLDPEDFSARRYPFWLLEWRLLRRADRIVYGSMPLGYFQSRMFPSLARRMSYIDVAFTEEPSDDACAKSECDPRLFGYIGRADPAYRNIEPLCEAFTNLDDSRLLVCGDIVSASTLPVAENIEYLASVPQSEIGAVEMRVGVFICLLNRRGIQVPGKVFYQTGTRRPILVIVDGRHRELICDYLRSFQRFVLCENSVTSITAAVNQIGRQLGDIPRTPPTQLAPSVVARDLLNGGRPATPTPTTGRGRRG